MKKKSRPLFIFYLLVAYVLFQFCWWAYHIINLQYIIYHLNLSDGIETNISAKIWMVAGEGAVFILILLIGAIFTRNSFNREVALGNQQKNFLLSVTHELKSPIAAAKLYLETLLKRDFEKDKQKEIINNTLKETNRLLGLIENILFSAKIESGSYLPVKEDVNISETTLEIISILKARDPEQKNQQFLSQIENNIFLNTDNIAFYSIVINLIENAAKYSPPQSKIIIELKKEKGDTILSIFDEGPGIPEYEKKNIFDKFYRIGNEETRKAKGTGLGLYIVKHLVEQLGGKISVRNNIPMGSIFEVGFKF